MELGRPGGGGEGGHGANPHAFFGQIMSKIVLFFSLDSEFSVSNFPIFVVKINIFLKECTSFKELKKTKTTNLSTPCHQKLGIGISDTPEIDMFRND